MPKAPTDAQLKELETLQGQLGRAPAKAAGLVVFYGPRCPIRGHGRIRLLVGSHCVDCVKAAAEMKTAARMAGRDAALKAARAEVARKVKAEEREAAAILKEHQRAQQRADRQKAARASERLRKRTERAQATTPAAALAESVVSLYEEDDDSPPWE